VNVENLLMKFVSSNKTTMLVQVEDDKFSIFHVAILCEEILINIPIGNKRSKIRSVMTKKRRQYLAHPLTKVLMHCLMKHNGHKAYWLTIY
jgi:hypothetical protein